MVARRYYICRKYELVQGSRQGAVTIPIGPEPIAWVHLSHSQDIKSKR